MNELILKEEIKIENMIYEIRGKQVMLDSDLAKLYQCKNGTKSINLAVKRHINRFPEKFMFQLSEEELEKLRFQFETTNLNNMSRTFPFAFTEQGVAMLATILKTPVAESVSIAIMDAFVSMKKYISNELLEQQYMKTMLLKHDNEINSLDNRVLLLQESFDKLQNKEQYEKLDILSIQKVLHDNFWRVRSKGQNSTDIITAAGVYGLLIELFTLTPLLILNETIIYDSLFTSLATAFIPFIVGSASGSGYVIKRNKDYMKVFNNINSKLGENALEQKYKNFDGAYEEEQEIEKLIENQIRDISLAEVQLQENRRQLDTFITEEDKKKENLFKDVQQLNITEEMENEVINASSSVEEKKSHRLVRKKISPNNK